MEFLRRRLGLILQVLVSVLVIAWLSRIVDWGEVWQKMRSMDPGWIFLGIICFIPVLLIVSFRWRMLLAVHGIHLRFWRVLELTMIGQFFGTIGLGTTGGDVAKVFYAARAVPTQRAAAAFTIIVDRVIGLMALLLFGGALALSQSKLLYSSKLALTPGLPDPKWVTSLFFLFAIGGIGAGIAATLGPYVMAMPKLRNLGEAFAFPEPRSLHFPRLRSNGQRGWNEYSRVDHFDSFARLHHDHGLLRDSGDGDSD